MPCALIALGRGMAVTQNPWQTKTLQKSPQAVAISIRSASLLKATSAWDRIFWLPGHADWSRDDEMCLLAASERLKHQQCWLCAAQGSASLQSLHSCALLPSGMP